MYDIAIIGGGPAGATLARLAARNFKVLLLEKRSFSGIMPVTAEKCCGGLLDPDAQQMLARFGLGLPKSVLLSPQLFAVRTIDMDNSMERYYQRHYINIDRNEFDLWLESIIPSSADIRNDCIFRSYEETEECMKIKYTHNGRLLEEKARLLAGADGAFSLVRRQGFSDRPFPERYISFQEWFEAEDVQNWYGAIFDSEITDFYSWTIPKENELILGTALKPGKEAHQKFKLLKRKLERYGFDFSGSIRRNGAWLLRPARKEQICTGKGRVVLLGEAAGFISPSSAEGMSYAFKSALALAGALQGGLDGVQERYRSGVDSLMTNILLKNLKSPAMYNPLLRGIILRTGLLSIRVENG